MGLIETLATSITTILDKYVFDVFQGLAAPLRILLHSTAVLALMGVAVNHVVQFRPVNYSTYLHWALRYTLIYAFATIWDNFHGLQQIFVVIPDDYSALVMKSVAYAHRTLRTDIIDPVKMKTTYSAMDEFAHAIVWIAHDFLRDTSILNLGKSIRNIFIGALILIIGGIFTAASLIIIFIGKVGFAVALTLAPLAIVLLMNEQTRSYFESWCRFAVGFAVIPLINAALMAVVLYVACNILADSQASSLNKDRFFGFLFVMISALVLMFHIPTMASTLASASVAAVGAGAAFAAGRFMKGASMNIAKRGRDGLGLANEARKSGASPMRVAWSTISGMRQSAMLRQERRDRRLAGRISGSGHNSPAKRRYQDGGGGSGGGGQGSGGDTQEQMNLNRS